MLRSSSPPELAAAVAEADAFSADKAGNALSRTRRSQTLLREDVSVEDSLLVAVATAAASSGGEEGRSIMQTQVRVVKQPQGWGSRHR